MKNIVEKVVPVVAICLMSGCATVEMAKYKALSLPEVALSSGAKVKFVAGNDDVSELTADTAKAFAGRKDMTVVEEDADYWFVLNGLYDYKDGGKVSRTMKVKKEREDGSGGSDVIVNEVLNAESAAKGVSVAVYDARNLAPVTYFEIPIYTGGVSVKPSKGKTSFDAAFSANVVERIKDAFLSQEKEVQVPVPLTADKGLREAFARGDYKGFMAKYKSLGPVDLPKLHEQVRRGEEIPKEVVEQKLSNYYLYLLVREAVNRNPDSLKKALAEHLMIMETGDYAGLTEAVPTALGRLEMTLNH